MPHVVRIAIAAAATAAVLLSGVWAGGSCAPARAESGAPPRLRTTDALTGRGDSTAIPVADSLTVNGQPMQLSVSFAAESPAAVAELYSAEFRARGLLPIAAADGRVAHVSSFDPQDGLQRSVTALRERSGHTLILMGITDPRHPPKVAIDAREVPFPVPENHRAFLGHSARDGHSRADSGQFVTALSPAEVAAFYRARLLPQGYSEQADQSTDALLVFGKNGGSVSVAVQALGARSGAAVFVNRTEGGP